MIHASRDEGHDARGGRSTAQDDSSDRAGLPVGQGQVARKRGAGSGSVRRSGPDGGRGLKRVSRREWSTQDFRLQRQNGVPGSAGGERRLQLRIASPTRRGRRVLRHHKRAAVAEVDTEEDYAKAGARDRDLRRRDNGHVTIPDPEAAMKKLGKSYDKHIFEGAGHGFMGNHAGAAGANLKASEQAWPLTIAFFQKHLK